MFAVASDKVEEADDRMLQKEARSKGRFQEYMEERRKKRAQKLKTTEDNQEEECSEEMLGFARVFSGSLGKLLFHLEYSNMLVDFVSNH